MADIFCSKNAGHAEALARRAMASARTFASVGDLRFLDTVESVLAECRFFAIGMADNRVDEATRHGYRLRLLAFLGDPAGCPGWADFALLWDCLDAAGRARAEATVPVWDDAFNQRVLWVRRIHLAEAGTGAAGVDVCGELTPTALGSDQLPAAVVAALRASNQLVGVLLRVELEIAMADLDLLRRLPELIAEARLMPLRDLAALLAAALATSGTTAD